MKLFFVNVECQVRKETRTISAKECAEKPYRTFTYAVVAETEREAIKACPQHHKEYWYEIKRYTQNPGGEEAGVATFMGASDHDRKRYPVTLEELQA